MTMSPWELIVREKNRHTRRHISDRVLETLLSTRGIALGTFVISDKENSGLTVPSNRFHRARLCTMGPAQLVIYLR